MPKLKLSIQITFEPNRLALTCVAQAYEQVMPVRRGKIAMRQEDTTEKGTARANTKMLLRPPDVTICHEKRTPCRRGQKVARVT